MIMREDARDVGLKRQRLQVEHQLGVLVEAVRNVGRPLGQLDLDAGCVSEF